MVTTIIYSLFLDEAQKAETVLSAVSLFLI